MIEVLFAFVITAGGYTGWCNDHPGECVAPIVKHAPKGIMAPGRNGQTLHALPGVIVISVDHEEGSPQWQLTYVHEATHYMQRKTRRFAHHNPYEARALTEAEAYGVGDKFLISKGRKPYNTPVPAELMEKARKARELGLVK